MLENIHEAKLLQPMASRPADIKAAWALRASSLEMLGLLARVPT